MGVKPDASHLPDECPRPLDHRGFQICLRSLIQVIHAWPLNCDNQYYLQDIICTSHLCSVTTAHLFHASVWMDSDLIVTASMFFSSSAFMLCHFASVPSYNLCTALPFAFVCYSDLTSTYCFVGVIFLHLWHILPYAGHCLGWCTVPHYLHIRVWGGPCPSLFVIFISQSMLSFTSQ